MPIIQVTTKSASSVWKSPDGQREIFEVELDFEGKSFRAKTYSKDISQAGWAGEVETYEKQGRNGSETFVKQPQKEGGYAQKGQWSGKGASKTPQDNFTMYLSYAKDIAVAMLDGGKLDQNKYAEVLEAVVAGGQALYEGRPDAPEKKDDVTPKQAELDVVINEIEEDMPWGPRSS